jgi:hypothetical protein
VDVETQALLRLDQQVTQDMRDSKEPDRFPPLCIGQADLLADDTARIFVLPGASVSRLRTLTNKSYSGPSMNTASSICSSARKGKPKGAANFSRTYNVPIPPMILWFSTNSL